MVISNNYVYWKVCIKALKILWMEKVWLSIEIVWKKLDEEPAKWDGDKK